jgi:hypothetical protein
MTLPQNIHAHRSGFRVRVFHNGVFYRRYISKKHGLQAAVRVRDRLRKKQGQYSKYRGVSFNQGHWQASVGYRYSVIYLGIFDTEREAALCYDAAARDLHGSRARPNFV